MPCGCTHLLMLLYKCAVFAVFSFLDFLSLFDFSCSLSHKFESHQLNGYLYVGMGLCDKTNVLKGCQFLQKLQFSVITSSLRMALTTNCAIYVFTLMSKCIYYSRNREHETLTCQSIYYSMRILMLCRLKSSSISLVFKKVVLKFFFF